jgi:plastocyanin
MRRRRRTLLAACLALALAPAGLGLAGCGGDGGAASAKSAGTDGGSDGLASQGEGPDDKVPADVVKMDGSDVAVIAIDNLFRAPDIQVRPGTKVTWTNKGRNDHDVLPVRGSAWGTDKAGFAPGDTYATTFDRPGVYHYYCSIHGTTTTGMVGTVVVAN